MKFIYFYSNLYEYYHNHINDTIGSIFEVEGVKIDDLESKNGHTFFGGVSIKIKIIIKKIKENIGDSIVFTDATIFINPNNKNMLVDFFNNYIENDLCFADNDGNGYYNIGIILIKCNEKTLDFFTNVLHILSTDKGWDQDIINKQLSENTDLKIDIFERNKVYCNWEFNPTLKDSFLIYKSFILHNPNIIINFNKRLDILKKYDLITEEEYTENYKYNDTNL